MALKYFFFSAELDTSSNQTEYKYSTSTDGKSKVRWRAITSTNAGINRIQVYFDLTKFAKIKDRLDQILLDNNHDNQHFANTTDRVTSLDLVLTDNGELQVITEVESTNLDKLSNPEAVIGFSWVLASHEENVITGVDGRAYLIDYEPIYLAYVTSGQGVPNLTASRIIDTEIITNNKYSTTLHMDNNTTPNTVDNSTQEQVKLSEFATKIDSLNETITKLESALNGFVAKFAEVSKPEPEPKATPSAVEGINTTTGVTSGITTPSAVEGQKTTEFATKIENDLTKVQILKDNLANNSQYVGVKDSQGAVSATLSVKERLRMKNTI